MSRALRLSTYKRFVIVLALLVLSSPHPVSANETEAVVTSALIATLRALLKTSPVRTEELIARLLEGHYECTLDSSDDPQGDSVRTGTTRSGLSVSVAVSAFPDGYREVVLSLGPAHVLEIGEIAGIVTVARLAWLDDAGKGRARSLRLYYDAKAARRSRDAWAGYCQSLSVANPDLPPLRLEEAHRRTFIALYASDSEGVFGSFCDYAGIPPDKRVAQIRLLAAGQVTALRYALRSSSTVSRLYAVEALLVLQRGGYSLSDADAALIQQLRLDEQPIETCSGCEHGSTRAKDAFDLFTTGRKSEFLARYRKLGYLD